MVDVTTFVAQSFCSDEVGTTWAGGCCVVGHSCSVAGRVVSAGCVTTALAVSSTHAPLTSLYGVVVTVWWIVTTLVVQSFCSDEVGTTWDGGCCGVGAPHGPTDPDLESEKAGFGFVVWTDPVHVWTCPS